MKNIISYFLAAISFVLLVSAFTLTHPYAGHAYSERCPDQPCPTVVRNADDAGRHAFQQQVL